MAHELSVDMVNSGLAIKIETKEKMMYKFARPGDSFNGMLRRVCEDLTKDVVLPQESLDRVARQIEDNLWKRKHKRLLAIKPGDGRFHKKGEI